MTICLTGPYPSVQAAWARRAPAIAELVSHAPPGGSVGIEGSGVAMLASDGALPLGTINPSMLERYWSDASGRLYCAHGMMDAPARLCVNCEREAL